MKKRLIALVCSGIAAVTAAVWPVAQPRGVYRSPVELAYSPTGRFLAVADHTGDSVAFVDATTTSVVRRTPVSSPWGVAWMGQRVYVAEYRTGRLAELDGASGRLLRRIEVGAYPRAVVAIPKANRLLVANTGSRDVFSVALPEGRVKARMACTGEPSALAVVPDGSIALVGYLIPTGDATREDNAARVALFETGTGKRIKEIALPPGSAGLRTIAVSRDGRWAMVPHTLGRYNLPTTQLDRGWVNTNALSILDMKARTLYATVLLDHTQEGAADPWGIVLSPDGTRAWITLSGAQQLACLDVKEMMKLMAGGLPDDSPLNKQSAEWAATMKNVWQEIKQNPAKRSELVNDLSALYIADLIERVPVAGNGPRGIALSPDGKTLAIAQYFTGDVALADRAGRLKKVVSLGPSAKPDAARQGERMFHDGQLCFQHWLSCATCHPDGRADGLNWDLLNDGMGNPKNNRSLLLAHQRGPMMSHGVRASVTVATQAGYRFILFREPKPSEVAATEAYIRSLRPLPSPRRLRNPDGSFGGLSPKALAGKAIFESRKAKCATCHSGPLFTDKKLHDTGTRGPYDSGSRFVTPTLIEVWRTAPYLHDGRAVTMAEVFTKFNRRDRHGVTSHLKPHQIDELSEYVLSL